MTETSNTLKYSPVISHQFFISLYVMGRGPLNPIGLVFDKSINFVHNKDNPGGKSGGINPVGVLPVASST